MIPQNLRDEANASEGGRQFLVSPSTVDEIRQEAKAKGPDQMTPKEINRGAAAARRAPKKTAINNLAK